MPSRKRIKIKRKAQSKSEDRSRIIECVEDQDEEPRATDHSLEQHNVKNVSNGPDSKSKTGGEKCSKEVHFAFLPDKYEQLKEEFDNSKVKSKEEELEKRRQKYKQIRKNVGKAVRFSWKCLVVGLQTFASVYSTPLSAASTIIPEMNRAHPRA
ncbi:required for drug-induced death protein 1 [Alosa pseudoharengus]|uniref:required for drug-induced death protein 1 n=1 Tax=Alosa pseudoharengus TaxID=34774 RepID=UPI003F8BF95B